MFVTDPERYFANIADNVVGAYINANDLNVLCEPFRTQIKLKLLNNYREPQRQYQCTFSGVTKNYNDFMNDFSRNGWDGWFEVTQNLSLIHI